MAYEQRTETRRPNVLLVVAEDMGPQLGYYGCSDARTPQLDAFAAAGAAFRTAWCAFPMCSPGRSALLTGLPPHENGTMGLSTFQFGTFDGVPSLPAIMNDAGYRTGLFGKLHLLPEDRFPFHLHWTDPELSFSQRNYPKMNRAIDGFVRSGDGPFFVMVALPDAHLPFLRQSFDEPPDPVSGRDVGVVPGMDRVVPELAEWYADYHNCIRRADTAFGELLALLDRTGSREKTLIVFTADHGLQFPRGKLSVYEPGLSIPLVIGGAGVQARPELIETPVCQTDVFTTILRAAGLPVPAPARGVSLTDIAGAAAEDRLIFGEITACSPHLYYPQRAVRNRRYKLIWTLNHGSEQPYYRRLLDEHYAQDRPPIPPRESLSPEMQSAYDVWRVAPEYQLYDLYDDPLETVNRSGDQSLAAVERDLRAALLRWREETDDFVLDDARRIPFETECERYVAGSVDGTRRNPDYQWEYLDAWRPRTLTGPKSSG